MEQWDRQQGETAKAYEAFCVYRDLGIGRQYAKTARELGKNESLIRRWARAWNWKERAEVWDKSVTEAARREAIQERMEILKETNQAARDIWQELLTAFKGKQDLSETPTKALIDGLLVIGYIFRVKVKHLYQSFCLVVIRQVRIAQHNDYLQYNAEIIPERVFFAINQCCFR